MNPVGYTKDSDGNYISKSIFDPKVDKYVTVELTDLERQQLSQGSAFENVDSEAALTDQAEKKQLEEPSIYTDLKRIGLNVADAPFRLASDFIVGPAFKLAGDTEYDFSARQAAKDRREATVKFFGDKTPSDVVDPDSGAIKAPETLTGKGLNIGTYLVGGVGVFKALDKVSAFKKLGIFKKGMISGAGITQILDDPDVNLANVLSEVSENPVVQYLAADKEDSLLLNRAKLGITTGVIDAAVGGIIGAFVKYGIPALDVKRHAKTLFGKTPEQLDETEIDSIVEISLKETKKSQTENPIEIIEAVKRASVDTDKGVQQVLKQSERSLTGFTKWIKQRYFTARGFLSEEAFKARGEAVSGQIQAVSSGVHHAKRLQKFIDDEMLATKDPTLSSRILQQLQNPELKDLSDNDQIQSIVESGLSKDIAEEIVSARRNIDNLSQYLVDNNVATEGVRNAVIENIGTYVTRSYRLFEDPSYVPSNDLIEETKKFFVSGMIKKRKLSPEAANLQGAALEKEAAQMVDNILTRDETRNLNDYITKVRAINKKVFAKRKDIDAQIKKLMGEIDSPTENIILTMSKLSSAVENHKFYARLNELGGSVPDRPELYKQAMDLSRSELKKAGSDFADLRDSFDIDVPKGTLFNLYDGRTATLIKRNENNSFRVNARDNKTGKTEEITIQMDQAEDGFIPPTRSVKMLADEIYTKQLKGGYTAPTYLKPEKSAVFNTRIKGTNSEIDGLFTTPELARSINGLEDTHMFWGLFKNGVKGSESTRYLVAAKGLSQQMKTVYDHTTHLRNALGGYQFGLANGINPLTDGAFNSKVLWNEIFQGNNKQFDTYYEKLQGMGVINTSVRAREARAMMEIASEGKLYPTELADKLGKLAENYKISRFGKDILINKPEQIYMGTDDFFKMNAFASELSSLKKIKPNAPLKQLEEEAAEIVKDTFPNYNRVTPGIKAIREMPFGNFVSFPAEILRTTRHIITKGVKEAVEGQRTNNTELRKRGLMRLGGFGTLNAAWFGSGYLGARLTGFTKDEDQALQTNLETSYNKHHNKIIVNMGGDLYAMAPTYIDSYAIMKDIALSFHRELAEGKFNGDTFSTRMTDATGAAIGELLRPFVSEAMFSETMGDIYRALKDPQGRSGSKEIIKDPDSNWSVVWGALSHAAKGFTPGVLTDLGKISEALFEEPNEFTGQKRSKGATALEMLSGVNFTKFDPADRFVGHVKTYKRTLLHERKRPSVRYGKKDTDYFKEWTKYTTKKFEASQKLYRHILAMDTLGYSSMQVMAYLKEAGITSNNEINALLNGDFYADKLSEQTKVDMMLQLKESGEENPEVLITDYLNTVNRLDLAPKGEAYKELNRELFKKMSAKEFRKNFERGGKVNVPDAKEEPDERIDRMTGLPYNIQAGALGIDEEDPEKRLMSNQGGRILTKLRQRRGLGGEVVKLLFKDVMTPVKSVGRGSKAKIVSDPQKPVVVRAGEEVSEELDPRVQRAKADVEAQSVAPVPGSFSDPTHSRFKGEDFKKELEDQGIEIDLDFGNYVVMGTKEGSPKPVPKEDVTDKTFQNLLISARASRKMTEGINKPLAKVNIYDGEDLTLEQMKKNYRDATGEKAPQHVKTNLVQPEKFKVIINDKERRLDYPIVAIQGGAKKMKDLGFKTDHGYALDVQFVGPVRMNRITSRNKEGKVPQPNLKPETVGVVKKGNIIGQIKYGKKIHDLYDYLEVDATPSLGKDVTVKEKFYRGGKVLRALANTRR